MIQIFNFLSRLYYGFCNTQYFLPKIKRHIFYSPFTILPTLFSSLSWLTIPPAPLTLLPKSIHCDDILPNMPSVCVLMTEDQQEVYLFQQNFTETKKKTLLFGNSISREEKQQAKEKYRILYIKQFYLSPPHKFNSQDAQIM